MIEHQIFSSEWLIMLMITFIFLLLIWRKTKPNDSAPNLPPGPWRLPIIGSMHHLVGDLPHRRMRELAQKYGPIMHLQLGELTNIVISSAEGAKEVTKTHDVTFAQRPQMLVAKSVTYDYKDITFSPYGDYWRQLRKICTMEVLTAKRVQSFKSIREEETSKLITSISCNKAGSPINLSRMITSLTYNVTSKSACGKIWKGEDLFLTSLEKILFETGRGICIADAYPSVKWLHMFSGIRMRVDRLQRQIDEIFQTILNEHRSARKQQLSNSTGCAEHTKQVPQEDLVDVLLNLQDNGDLEFPLTDDTIKALIMDMFVAGVDTSATTVEWVMSELMKNPEVMRKVQEEVRQTFDAKGNVDEADLHELKYLKMVIKETLRLHPPIPLLVPRECREECVIDGYDIPLKSKVIVNAWAIGRDPKYWNEAEKFNPERFVDSSIDFKGNNFEFIPFGAGRRSCPGMLFGLANVELPLAKLLYHFDWKLTDGIKPETLDMSEELGGVTKRKFPLSIIPTPYLPNPTSTNY